jgi:phage terminase Nu1 subunit (DNA packaging protein)
MNDEDLMVGHAPPLSRVAEQSPVVAERYVSRRELAELMGVSVDCVDYFVRLGMPSETWGLRRRVFRASAALAWARDHADRTAA